jgi:CubicO group peptidase (beta-lactamase class C family)
MEETFPEDNWQTCEPADIGIEPAALRAALARLESRCGPDGLDEAILVRHGRVCRAGPAVDSTHCIYSCSKSFTSTVLGLLIAEGKCSLDTRAAEVEPLLAEHYPDVTLRHFTTMTSGYDAVGRSRWGEDSEDWSETPYDPAPPLFPAGTAFCYWDEAMMMLGRVLTRIAGESLRDYLDRRVMQHIGFGAWSWWPEGDVDGLPVCNGGTSIEVNALQLARFGLLFLNGGSWDGEQLVPADWVGEATSPQVPAELTVADTDRADVRGSGCYGYSWWTNGLLADGTWAMPNTPPRASFASGLKNNVCFVVPEWDIVLVRMGEDWNPPAGKMAVYDEFFGLLSAAVAA